MKAAQIQSPNHIKTIELPTPTPAGDEVLIKVIASGVCGTDIHIYRGEYLGEYPLIPGHEFSGVVEDIGEAVKRFKPGDRVAVEPNIACDNCANCLNQRHNFCLNWSAVGVSRPGGMAQYVSVPEKAAFDIGDLPFETAAFMEPLSCVLHGVERLAPELAARIAIFGAGPIGILLLQALRSKGAAQIDMADRNPARAGFAQEMGADLAVTRLEDLPHREYDAVVDATGVVAVMQRSIDFLRHGGKALLFGVPPAGDQITLEAFPIFRKGLTILSSFTSLRNSSQALALLQSGQISVEGLVSHRLPLDDLGRGIEILEGGLEGVGKVMVMPQL